MLSLTRDRLHHGKVRLTLAGRLCNRKSIILTISTDLAKRELPPRQFAKHVLIYPTSTHLSVSLSSSADAGPKYESSFS